jgi:hypothetical protein
MVDAETYRTFLRKVDEEPSAENLTRYLRPTPEEDRGSEFKRAYVPSDFQVRKAVASLANYRRGGEVFLGIEEDGMKARGTTMSRDDLERVLHQENEVAEGFILDLNRVVEWMTPVPTEGGRRTWVLESRPGILPSLVAESSGDYVWYVRDGRSDRRLKPQEWVAGSREFERGVLLWELYREYRLAVVSVPTYHSNDSLIGPTYFSLPGFESAKADRSIYSVLTDADRRILVAGDPPPNGAAAPGYLTSFVRMGTRIDLQLVPYSRDPGGKYREAEQQLIMARQEILRNLEAFEEYLRGIGILPPKKP